MNCFFFSLFLASQLSIKCVYGYSNPNTKSCNNEGILNNRRELMKKALASAAAAILPLQAAFAVSTSFTTGGKITYGEESIMNQKNHGTTDSPVQENLRFGVSRKVADKICCYNRHFAEFGGYFRETNFLEELGEMKEGSLMTFYDSVSGKPLFQAPIGRSVDDFIAESITHGWPSFRDSEVVWDNVRVLKNSGETVSVDGTHLGHNLPDRKGNRYCINLVSVAGNAV